MRKIISLAVVLCFCFSKTFSLTFTHHQGVKFLLKMMNKRVLVYHCKEAEKISKKAGLTTLEYILLKCDVLGNVANITLQHNFREIPVNSDGRYLLIAQAHRGPPEGKQYSNSGDNDCYFKNWIEYTLKIYKPRPSDTGIYEIKVQSPDGDTESQIVYVDLTPYSDLLGSYREHKLVSDRRSRKGNVPKSQRPRQASHKRKEYDNKADGDKLTAGDVRKHPRRRGHKKRNKSRRTSARNKN